MDFRARRWVIPLLLLQALPALAQERKPDPEAQPSTPAGESAPQAPAVEGSTPSSAAAPGSPAPEEKEGAAAPGSLEDLLQEEVSGSAVGSFGYRLRRYGITPYIHGVVSANLFQWKRRLDNAPSRSGFLLRDASLYFGADILDLIVPELFLEFEPNLFSFDLNTGVRIRHAQLDVRLYRELLVLRAGLFLTPFGNYNAYTSPRFITKLPDRPAIFREVFPTPWQEVGVQMLGEWEWSPERKLRYAVYVTNGMEQRDNALTPAIEEGGSLITFSPSYEDLNNNVKSLGARVNMEFITGLSVGLSGYTGGYTKDAKRRLSLVGLDAQFTRGAFSLEFEAAYTRQELTEGDLVKWGYVVVAAYHINEYIEPVLIIDEARLDQGVTVEGIPGVDTRGYWGGIIFYPFPDQISTAVAKAVYRVGVPLGRGTDEHRFILQLAVGF